VEQIRERETEQAIDRLRLIHRDRPARVLLLSNVVVDVTVDRLVGRRELVPDRLTVAAARLDGVLPLAPKWLAGRCGDLWVSAEAVRRKLSRAELTGQIPSKSLYLGFARLTPAAYRLEGQRGPHPSRALIVAGHPAPEAALAALVGPLAMFRWEGEPEEPLAEAMPAAATCTRCAKPAEFGHELCAVCLWLARPPPPVARAPPRHAAVAQP
jgi:hypothetical protein